MKDFISNAAEELDKIARENIKGTSEFQSMRDVLIEMMGGIVPDFMLPSEEEIPSMYILTNTSKNGGAANLLDDAALADISEKVGGDFMILPSSIHEAIILPQVSDDLDLQGMVCEINATQVAPEERLSDNVYRYDSASRKVVCTTAA